MGKKVIKQRQALISSKISKKDHYSKHQHQEFNSLIKVLRPKVYITDSSSFKNLVQQLTGNGNGNITTSTSTSTSTSTPPPVHDDDHPQVQFYVETLSASFNTEPPNSASSSGFCDLDQFWNSEIMCLDQNDAVFEEDHLGLDEINYIESLLFDEKLVEEQQIPFYGQLEQDISIYDYDFSGFIN